MPSLKLLLLAALSLVCETLFGQTQATDNRGHTSLLLQPKVDKRIELVSIAFRIAGYPEYCFEENKTYVADIHNHFDQYAAHPLISFLKQIRDTSDIRFDAVMAMAVHLSPPPQLTPIVPFVQNIPDDRWESAHHYKDTFISLLQHFYNDTGFETFFSKEQELYHIAEQRYRIVFDSMDAAWYRKFYGNGPASEFHTIIGFGNGRANYGLSVKHTGKAEDIYAIVGSWRIDSAGLPIYTTSNNLPTLIHEFNHSFINHLNEQYRKDLQQAGQHIYKEVSAQMEDLGYPDWKIMLDEALVRAAVIKYIKAHSNDAASADKALEKELKNGFTWMNELVSLLDQYEQNRKKYPTLQHFMPIVISFYNITATNLADQRTQTTK